jgi:hypothetical protein
MSDITILYITANMMPKNWYEFQIHHLKKSIRDSMIVSISRKELDLGYNLIDTNERCYWNIYRQMLRGAKVTNTPYIAMAEDDVLYTEEHFFEFRPKLNEVAYDRARWSLFAWEKDPIYCMRQRISNCSLIAPREYLIEALEEREQKYPNGNDYVGEVGRNKVENKLGVSIRNCVEFYCNNPIVQLNHPAGIDETQQRCWKKHGQMKAFDIPYWGKAEEIVRIYENK